MSGLLCIWNSQKQAPWQTMLNDLEVLGRDGKGSWHNPDVGISLGRTQFFNTPESTQEEPVVVFEGCHLVWSGRLDDRDTIPGGNHNHTDAQLLILAYRQWGENCLSRLIGEYVFILWDAHQDRLLVGCDKVGTRPISYYWDGQTLLVSSRVVTLLHHPQVSHALDEQYITHNLCNFWGYPSGITPFADIKRILPGQVLSLQSGKFSLRRVTDFEQSISITRKKPEAYYEEFWEVLNRSIQDRLRTHLPVCSTLSGGLDSTTVAVGLLNHLPALDAFSTVTEIYPEFDEREPIHSFLAQYPQVRWHDINADQAWSFSEPWDELPVPDDPIVTCSFASSVQLNQQMRQQGFGLCFDGEGGDELFRVNLFDLLRGNSWSTFLQRLQSEKRWHSSLLWECILPYMPRFFQSYWFRRSCKIMDLVPPWLNADYVDKSITQEALTKSSQTDLETTQLQGIKMPYEASDIVGSNQFFKLSQSFYGVEYTSPMLDQRMVEFAMKIPPTMQQDTEYGKIFLRNANQSKLPEKIRWKQKENYFDPLKFAGVGKGLQILEILAKYRQNEFLEKYCDLNKIEESLREYRTNYSEKYKPGKPFQNDIASELYALATLFNWHKKVEKMYF